MSRPLALGSASTLLSVVLAGLYAVSTHGRFGEIVGYAVWSIPIGVAVGIFARKQRIRGLPPFFRSLTAAVVGVLVGFGLTFGGFLLIGGWMYAWDFPVLYCWSVAGAVGMVLATVRDSDVGPRHATGAVTIIAIPVAVLWIYGTRPQPAVLIVYRDHPAFDAAQFVLDSVLSEPHPSGHGRGLRWSATSYSRTRTVAGETAAVIGLRRTADRDSIRAALADHPLVSEIADTLLSR